MSSKTSKMMFAGLIIVAVAIFGLTGIIFYQQYGTLRCEACGMAIMTEAQTHISITEPNGNRHYACCQGCMLRLLDPKKGYAELHIETFCDYYGPQYKIIIDAKNYGNTTTVTPNTSVILLGTKIVASCANNRIAYNQTAADALLKQGYTEYTMMFQRNPLPNGTPVMSVPKVAVAMSQKGIAYMPPSPLVPSMLALVGVIIVAGSFIAYRKLKI